MNLSDRNAIARNWAMLLFIFATGIGLSATAQADSMIPQGLSIKDHFEPGLGTSVGKVEQVQGKVLLIHIDMSAGYWARQGLPLFRGDTIITQEKARIRFELNDGSILTLASQTKLALKRSVYDLGKRSRSSFISMATGKARFWVKKLSDFKRTNFTVKTNTAVVGVRGSDFVIRSTDKITEITALDDTELEVLSLAAPDAAPVVINEFKRTVVEEGTLPSAPEVVSQEIIEKIREELNVAPEKEASAPETKVWKTRAKKQEILVPKAELVRPEHMGIPGNPERQALPGPETRAAFPPLLPPLDERSDILEQNEKMAEEKNMVIQDKKELDKEIIQFPPKPE